MSARSIGLTNREDCEKMTVSRDHYYRLASDIEEERLLALKLLLNELSEAGSDSEYTYALDRLIKGLSSSRASARIGFSTCLTEILSVLILRKSYSVAAFIKDLDQKIRSSISKSNGKNERAILFGKLFGFQALLNSGLFQDADISQVKDNFIEVLCQIIELSLTKSWIRETCFATIFQALREKSVTPHVLGNETNIYIMRLILRKLDETNLNLTSEGLLIYLGIQPSERSQILELAVISPERNWRQGNPLARENIQTLSKVLKESGSDDDNQEQNQQKGSWQPRLNYVWGLLLNEILHSPNLNTRDDTQEVVSEKHSKKRSKSSPSKSSKKAKHGSTITFSEFWKIVVDEQFFSSNASAERKYWGFEILRLSMNLIEDPELIQVIFSKNLMRSLINQNAKSDRLLNKIAKVVLEDVIQLSTRNAEFRIPLLEALIKSENGNINFDSLTKSKTCESIITTNPEKDRESLVFFFERWFNNLQVEADLQKYQIFLVDQILLVIKSSTCDISTVLSTLLDLFVKMSFFIPVDQKVNDDSGFYNTRISEICQGRLKSLLAAISKNPDVNLSQVVEILKRYENDSKLKLRLLFDEELSQVQKETFGILEQIKLLKEHNLNLKCFEILYSITIIQLYSGDVDSISLIPELNVAFDKNISNEVEDSNEILIDILLTFVSQKSQLMKQLSFVIWDFLIENGLKFKNLEPLIDIITTKENKDGQDKLFNAGDDDLDESDDDDDSHSHSHESEEEENVEEEESDQESESEDSGSDDMEEVDMKTNIALAEALGIPATESGEVKFDSDDDDDDEEESDSESMSDEQMMSIDDQLSTIFQQRKNAMDSIKAKSGNQRKLDVMDARQNMVFFKNRVLDLIARFNDTKESSCLNVHFVLPLLELIQLTLDKQVGEKAHKLLRNKICKSKVEITEQDNISENDLFSIMREIHQKASKSSIKAHTLASNQSSIFIAKVLVKNYPGDTTIDKIIDLYSDSIKAWSKDKSSKIQSTMYFDFINWINSKRN